jgi:hypothetical protein
VTALECEAALVAAATRGAALPIDLAALAAVASRYLAVGTPRSFGVVGDGADALLAAHRTWFAPRELRLQLPEALGADIVCITQPLTLSTTQLRRGTHVNILAPVELEAGAARIVRLPDLAQIAAGFVDGRERDEITIFIAA